MSEFCWTSHSTTPLPAQCTVPAGTSTHSPGTAGSQRSWSAIAPLAAALRKLFGVEWLSQAEAKSSAGARCDHVPQLGLAALVPRSLRRHIVVRVRLHG